MSFDVGVVMKDIPGFSTLYQAGSDGNIYSFVKNKSNGRLLKAGLSSSGHYLLVSVVRSSGTRVSKDVHSLVCRAFHGEPVGKVTVAHIDGNSRNNLPSNLRWKATRDNLKDRFLHGTHDSGTSNSRAIMDDESLLVTRWLLENTKLSHEKISEIMGCHRLTVTKIKGGSRYGNIGVRAVSFVVDEVIKDALDVAISYQ